MRILIFGVYDVILMIIHTQGELSNIMSYSLEEFAKHMQSWNQLLTNYKLPTWDELPTIELYMDQVIALMNQYLNDYIPSSGDLSQTITPPMINNYVKQKVMPAPVKKRYSRIHIAYLIMLCSLKQALSIPTMQKILPLYETEADAKDLYDVFCKNQYKAFNYITEKVCAVTDPLLKEADSNPERMYDLSIQIAVSANVFKMLSEDVASIKRTENE